MNFIEKIKYRVLKRKAQPSLTSGITYSQTGEDVIVKFVFDQLDIAKPSFLDLGAHHPALYNNTCIFYKNGSRGINVEPDPFLIQEFKRSRPGDINLNVGIGYSRAEETADFYIMSAKTLNTFSHAEALKIESYGTYRIEKVIQVRLLPIDAILKHGGGKTPNFITLDVEGLDYQIIQSFDLQTIRPEVFCIETISYTEDNSEKKLTEIIKYMEDNNYFVFADTYINTIFVDKSAWLNR